MATMTYTGRLVVTSCWCGIHLAIPEDLYDFARRRGQGVHCPLGHTFVYGDSENVRLKRELEEERTRLIRTRARLDQAQAETEHQRKRVQGYQGALVKTKKRAAAGVCPVSGCKRSFANVAAHVRSQHPDYEPAVVDEAVTVK